MSVIKNKRKKSEMEFLHNLDKLRKEMTGLLLRDFGLKARNRDIKFVTKQYGMSKEQEEAFTKFCDEHEIAFAVETYPEWLVNEFRLNILHLLRDINEEARIANSIFPTSEHELDIRRDHQNEAIGKTQALLSELQYIVTTIPVNAKKYMPYVEMTKRQLALLKGWRKSDNKLKCNLK